MSTLQSLEFIYALMIACVFPTVLFVKHEEMTEDALLSSAALAIFWPALVSYELTMAFFCEED